MEAWQSWFRRKIHHYEALLDFIKASTFILVLLGIFLDTYLQQETFNASLLGL